MTWGTEPSAENGWSVISMSLDAYVMDDYVLFDYVEGNLPVLWITQDDQTTVWT